MTPKEYYENVAARARYFLRLHDGLINLRQRGIRADWAASCRRLMRWPQSAAIERVDSADAMIVLRDGSDLQPEDFSADALDDLLRAALTFGVSALDRYVHERVVKGIVSSLRGRNLTRNQEEFGIPAVVVMRMTENVLRARREGRPVRPANEVRKAVQDMLHRRPLQNWREIEYALDLLGITGYSGKIQAAFGVGDVSPIRNQLNKICRERNYIVHEGGLVRHQRGGLVRKRPVSSRYVARSLDFLDDFVEKLESVSD